MSKKVWGLMSVHTGEVLKNGMGTSPILELRQGDLIYFLTKKSCTDYRNKKLTWALIPVKIVFDNSKYMGKQKFYSFC
jgi:hypothetical protein